MAKRIPLLLLLAAALLVSNASAQVLSASGTVGAGTFRGQMTIQPPVGLPPAVTGAPYSAEQVSEHSQTLIDGTHITQTPRIERMYRDAAGRTRIERPVFGSPMSPEDAPPLIQISDPVVGCQYTLDEQKRVAYRFAYSPRTESGPEFVPAKPAAAPNARTATGASASSGGVLSGGGSISASWTGRSVRPEFASESLGTQMIEGVMAQGTRRTTTYPTGSMGNDRPIVTTNEMWMSPDLKVMVLSKNTDPRNGESKTYLRNLSRAEPDPALFQPPPDYKIVDETGPVTIKFARP